MLTNINYSNKFNDKVTLDKSIVDENKERLMPAAAAADKYVRIVHIE